MEVGTLNAIIRAGSGKSVTRKLRAEGKIPAICYGGGHDPIMLSIDPAALVKALNPEKRANTVITLSVEGGAKPQSYTVMLRDWQRDPLKGSVLHADFLQVSLDKEVHATVPLVIVGKSEGVKAGGTLHQVFRSLEVACTPDKIPVKIEVNIDKLGMGDALHVSQLVLGAGVRALVDGTQTVCTVTAPKAEKVAAEAEVAAEGAAAAAPAAGAAAAAGAKPAAGGKEGDKAGAKPAAAAKAPEKKK